MNPEFSPLNYRTQQQTVSNSFFLEPMYTSEIEKINLKTNSNLRLDGLNNIKLNQIAPFISIFLKHILNICFETKNFPSQFKVVIVKPLFRIGDSACPVIDRLIC